MYAIHECKTDLSKNKKTYGRINVHLSPSNRSVLYGPAHLQGAAQVKPVPPPQAPPLQK
jgi:hypothetical protein